MDKIAILLIIVVVIVFGTGNYTQQKTVDVVNGNTSALSIVGQNQLNVNDQLQTNTNALQEVVNGLRSNTAAVEGLQTDVQDMNHRLDIVETRMDGVERLTTAGIVSQNRMPQLPQDYSQGQTRTVTQQLCRIEGQDVQIPCHQDASGAWILDQ